MNKFALLCVSASILAATAPSALAQGFYVDGGYSSLITDYEEDFDLTFELKLGAISGHIGYDVSPYFGVEAEGLYGITDDTYTVFAVGEVAFRSTEGLEDFDYEQIDTEVELNHLVGAFAKAMWPLSDRFTAFGRAGYVTAELEGSANIDGVSISVTESGDGPAYGVGLTADLENRFFIRGDFTFYDVEGGETEALMLGAGLRF